MAEEGPLLSLPSLVAPSMAALFFLLPLPLHFLPPACVEFGVVVGGKVERLVEEGCVGSVRYHE